MKFGWTEVIAFFTLLQLSLLAVVAFKYKKGRALSNRLLAAFLTANALLILQFLLTVIGWSTKNRMLILTGTGSSMYLLLTPLLYLYIQSLCYKDFQLRRIHLLHAVPCAVVTAFFLVRMSTGEQGIDAIRLSGEQIRAIEYLSHKIIVHLQVLIYLVASLVLLVAYRKRLKGLYSSIESIDLSWCNLLLVGFAGMWFIDLLGWALSSLQANPEPVKSSLVICSLLVNLLLALAVTYRGLLSGGTFSGILTPPKYAASTLRSPECGKILERLLKFVEEEKPYLDPSLTIEGLARRLGVSPKHLSQTIHSRLNQSFYDFINAQRIEAAKDCLQSEASRTHTVLAVAYEVGFNSKSVFNAAFKRHTGMTPKDFRRRSREGDSPSSIVFDQ